MFNLRLQDVSLGYRSRLILKNVNLDIMPGEMLGIIGPNGSGKSTLIKSLSRLLQPISGRIYIDGKTLNALKPSELSKIVAVVPQNAIIPDLFTSLEVVLMGRTPHLGLLRYEGEKDYAIALEAMETTDTFQLAHRIIKELSGGEKQRLLLARALAQQPKILLLDEPVANLDINHQIETLNLVNHLCHEQNLIVVIALHDLNLAVQYCHRLAILHNHRIEHLGMPENVVNAKIIREIYGANVMILRHPVNNLPVSLIVPNNRRS